MKVLFRTLILCSAILLSAGEEIIQSTGTLTFRTTAEFHNQWITVTKAPKGNERRFYPAKAPDGTAALCAGRFGKNQMPLARYVFGNGKNGQAALFDVSKAGEENAFTAQTDFLFHRQHKRPIERIEIPLDVMSADQKTVYHICFYTNGDIWNKNYFKMEQLNLADPGRNPKSFLWETVNAKLKKGAWYRLKMKMIRMNTNPGSPVTFQLALYEIAGNKSGGEDGKKIAEAISRLMPSPGDKIKFSITEPALPPYVVYINHISAGCRTNYKAAAHTQKTATQQTVTFKDVKTFRDYLMNRKNEYKKGTHQITLAKNGKAQFVIVCPANAADPVRFAAKELKNHLDKITGANFKIVTKRPAGAKAIIPGNSPEAIKAGIDVKKIARDGFRIIAKPDLILIAGLDESNAKSKILFSFMNPKNERKPATFSAGAWNFQRGSLYGTYRFLEELGVRWFMPGDIGTVIPKKKTLTLTAFDALEEPVFEGRSGALDGHFYRKNRRYPERDHLYLNILKWTVRNNYLWVLRMRRPTTFYPLNHHPPSNQYEERFGKTHPEYFALYNGKRSLRGEIGDGRTGALCYGNPGTIQEILKDLTAFADGVHASKRGYTQTNTQDYGMCENNGWPQASNFGNVSSLLPHDVFQPCECTACAPLLAAEDGGQMSEIVWKFMAQIGNEMLKRRPGHILTCLAYSSYAKFPMTVSKLPNNVMVGILPCTDQMNQPYALAKPERYKNYFKIVKKWNTMNDMPLAFWVHWLFRTFEPKKHYGVPMILPGFTAKYFREAAKYGRIMYMELDTDNYIMEHLNRYIFIKLLLNPDQDAQALVNDYAEKMYGPAGDIFKEIFRDIEQRCEKIAASDATQTAIWKDQDKFAPQVLKRYRTMVTEAEKRTKNTKYSAIVGLFSSHFLGVMESGSKEYFLTSNADEKRIAMVKAADRNKVIDLTKGKTVTKELIPLYGYEDFQTAEATLSGNSKTLKIHLAGKEKSLNKLLAKQKKNGVPAIWGDDSYEIMLVNPTGSDYVQIIVNCNGAYYIKPFNRMKSADYKVKTNANIAPEFGNWTLDLEIPMAQFNPKGLKGNWKINLFRNRRAGGTKKDYQSSGLYLKEYHFHRLEQYYTLQLD